MMVNKAATASLIRGAAMAQSFFDSSFTVIRFPWNLHLSSHLVASVDLRSNALAFINVGGERARSDICLLYCTGLKYVTINLQSIHTVVQINV